MSEVDDFLATVADDRRRADAAAVVALVRDVTGVEPRMWGSMIGFGERPYTTADGKQHAHFALGLAPRKAALVLYGLLDDGDHADLLDRLGPHTTGRSCLNLTRVEPVDREVLAELVERAWSAGPT